MSLRKYDKEWLEELCKDSLSLAEVLRKAGRKQGGGSQETLKKKIKEFNIDISHFTGQQWNKGLTREEHPSIQKQAISSEKYSFEEIFCDNSSIARKVVKSYIICHNLIEYKCSTCGCTGEWQGGKIPLELHHKDGKNNNHTFSNLEFLCPNCHALTDTYKGKNKSAGMTES